MRSPAINLLCLPCAGASATMYLRWRRYLPQWVQVTPMELPGRGGRLAEACVEDFEELVRQLAQEQAQAMQSDYALFGHSMGALLAHGIVRHRAAQGQSMPRALFASGSPGPARRHPDSFAAKGDDAALMADLRRQGGTLEDVFGNAELLRLTLDVLGADYRVCESFRHTVAQPLPVPVHVFAGQDDDLTAERIEAWQQEAAGAFSLRWFEGGHFFLRGQEQRVVAAIAADLTRCLFGGVPPAVAHA